MAKTTVTIRVRIGDREIEVTGPADFVEQKIAEFFPPPKPPGQQVQQEPSGDKPARASKTTGKELAPGQFLSRANPKTDLARVLAAAYYLEKFRNVDSFTAAEIRDLIRAAKRPPPANTNDVISKNIGKGLIMAAGDRDGGKAFNLTSDGEAEVQEMLDSAK